MRNHLHSTWLSRYILLSEMHINDISSYYLLITTAASYVLIILGHFAHVSYHNSSTRVIILKLFDTNKSR